MELKQLLQAYQAMSQEGFINYYKLFKLNRFQSREDLLAHPNLKELSEILVPEKFAEHNLDPSLQRTYENLCRTYKQFVKWTLLTDYNKSNYDKRVIEYLDKKKKEEAAKKEAEAKKQNERKKLVTDYRYIFEKTSTKPQESLGVDVRKLYNALENGIEKYGVSVTVAMLNKLFKLRNVSVFDEEMVELLKPYTNEKDINALIKELNKKHKASNTLELAEKVVGEMISRKVDVLASALDHTGEKHGFNQIVLGLTRYIQEKDATSISKGTDKIMGREKLMMELRPEFVKIVLAAMDSDKTLLLDFPEYLDREYNDEESISKIALTIIQTKKKGFRK